jgi:hypothetical protein
MPLSVEEFKIVNDVKGGRDSTELALTLTIKIVEKLATVEVN